MTRNGDIVNERERPTGRRMTDRLVPVLAIMVVALFAVCAVLSYVAFSTASSANATANRVSLNADRIAAVERRDRRALRGASYRTCEREQRDRAEQHLRAGLSPPAVIVKLVRQLGLPDELAKQVSIGAVRLRLPIFDCSPNLYGRQARPLTAREQARYVHRYATGKLNPNPG